MAADTWTVRYEEKLNALYYRADAPAMRLMAEELNAEFGTTFSRNALIGKCQRMGLTNRCLSKERKGVINRQATPRDRSGHIRLPAKPKDRTNPFFYPRAAPAESREVVKLRCVEITPLHLTLIELDHGLCKYPYGGDADGEAITFCGHTALKDQPYCMPHKALCFGHGTASERAATKVRVAA